LGGEGNDRLDGGRGTDMIDAGGGNDLIVWDPLDAGLAGGAGFDILGVGQGDLDLSASGGALSGIEMMDMRGGEASTAVLTATDVLEVSDSDALTVLGDAGDSLAAGPGWADGGTDAAGLRVFTQDVSGTMATLVVQPDVQTNPEVVA
jgi:Ca2+-binding RTX toxin-like protein